MTLVGFRRRLHRIRLYALHELQDPTVRYVINKCGVSDSLTLFLRRLYRCIRYELWQQYSSWNNPASILYTLLSNRNCRYYDIIALFIASIILCWTRTT